MVVEGMPLEVDNCRVVEGESRHLISRSWFYICPSVDWIGLEAILL